MNALLYADDIVLVTSSVLELQTMLDTREKYSLVGADTDSLLQGWYSSAAGR